MSTVWQQVVHTRLLHHHTALRGRPHCTLSLHNINQEVWAHQGQTHTLQHLEVNDWCKYYDNFESAIVTSVDSIINAELTECVMFSNFL